MEIKQEVTETTGKLEIDNDTCVGSLDAFKIEIKEEPKTETAYQAFDYVDLNELTVNTEVECEDKFISFEEKQTTNEERETNLQSLVKLLDTLQDFM
ncbi:uncharacterized protein [Diabrotica undecimpunctata]|uniref:uncharacterized protein isoform X2 n=1 Tax=Diabrotica undecimpunctata TaxID=50387 RepID=UPI003B6381DA